MCVPLFFGLCFVLVLVKKCAWVLYSADFFHVWKHLPVLHIAVVYLVYMYTSCILDVYITVIFIYSKISFFFFNIFIYLFLAALVPCSLQCVGLSLQWPPSLRSTGCRHVGFSSCGMRGSAAAAHGLYSTGSVVVVHRQHVGSSPTRAQTHVPCIGRWILNHCATREVPKIS